MKSQRDAYFRRDGSLVIRTDRPRWLMRMGLRPIRITGGVAVFVVPPKDCGAIDMSAPFEMEGAKNDN